MKERLWKKRKDSDVVLILRRDLEMAMDRMSSTEDSSRSTTDASGNLSTSLRSHITFSSKNALHAHILILAHNSTFFAHLLLPLLKDASLFQLHEPQTRHVEGHSVSVELSEVIYLSGTHESGKRPVWYVDISHLFRDKGSLRYTQIKWFKKAVKSCYSGQLPGIPEGQELLCYNVMRQFGFHALRRVVTAYMATFLTNAVDACAFVPEALRRGHCTVFEMGCKLIHRNASRILSTNLIYEWDEKIFEHTLREDSLDVGEVQIFQTAVKWCERKAEEQGSTLTQQFKKIEDLIRYPLMNPDDIMDTVEPTGLVSQHLLEEAYMYNSISFDLKDKFFKKNIRCKTRGSSRMRFKWVIDPSVANCLSSSDGGITVKMTASGSKTIFGDTEIKSPGSYFWEVELQNTNASSCYVMVGVGQKGVVQSTSYLGNSPKGWALYLFNCTAYNNSSTKLYAGGGSHLRAGTRIGVVVVAKSQTCAELYFIINGKSGGMAFDNVTLPVHPALTLANASDVVRTVQTANLPSGWKRS